MTNGELISKVKNGLNSISKDDRISGRYILSVARSVAEFFISQKLNDRSVYREENLYTSVDCFMLKRIDVTRCDIAEFRNANSIMKSVKRVPELIYSKYGNSLKEVTTIDNLKDFRYTTPSQWRRDKIISGKQYEIKFYVKDGYLYLMDTEVESVNLRLLTLITESVEAASNCTKKSCKSLWELDFIYPSKMIKPILDEIIREVAFKKSITQDTNPNLDSNQKGKTTA